MTTSTVVTVYDSCADSDSISVDKYRPHVRLVATEGNRTVKIYLDRRAVLELIAALAGAAT